MNYKKISELDFDNYRNRIAQAIIDKNKKIDKNKLEDTSLDLLDGFIDIPMNGFITENNVKYFMDRTLPMVAFVGKESGKVYFYSLFSLLPELIEEFGFKKCGGASQYGECEGENE